MRTGKVTAFDRRLGSGLIRPDDGSEDVPVHVSALERAGLSNLLEGDRVSFNTLTNRTRGKSFASNLRLL